MFVRPRSAQLSLVLALTASLCVGCSENHKSNVVLSDLEVLSRVGCGDAVSPAYPTLGSVKPDDIGFTWLNPLPQSNHLLGVSYGGSGKFFAVGPGVVIESDGLQWVNHYPPIGWAIAVLALSPTEVYVGDLDGTILGYDGSQWTRLPDLQLGGIKRIAGRSRNDLWIVTWWRGEPVFRSGASQWEQAPALPDDPQGIIDLGIGQNVYACGSKGIYRFDEARTRWVKIFAKAADFTGIWVADNDEIFAITEKGVVFHGRGDTWSQTELGSNLYLTGVDGSDAENVWVVDLSQHTFHFDGTYWEECLSDRIASLKAIAVGDRGDAVAVGQEGAMMRIRDGAWKLDSVGDSGFICQRIVKKGAALGIHGSGEGYFSVLGDRVSKVPIPLDIVTFDAWASPPGNSVLVGYEGKIVRETGNAWVSDDSPTSRSLHAVDGTADDDIWAGGEDGVLLHFDGSSWSPTPSGVSDVILDLWVAGPNDVYAIHGEMDDRKGVGLLHYDGVAWSLLDDNRFAGVSALWGRSPDDFFVVGQRGKILRIQSGQIEEMQSNAEVSFPFQGNLLAVHCNASGIAYAVGYGTILRLRNGEWERVPNPVLNPLIDVHVMEDGTAIVVGAVGTVARVSASAVVDNPI